MSSLKNKIQEDIKQALKLQRKEQLVVLRMIAAAIKQHEVDTRTNLTEQDELEILTKMLKKSKESMYHFKLSGRDDLIAKESLELEVIKTYLPPQLTEAAMQAEVEVAIKDLAATSLRDLPKVMQYLRKHLLGRADLDQVATLVKNLLRVEGK